MTADGNGHITAGTLDLNSASGYGLQGVAIIGAYQLDETGKGGLALTTPQGMVSLNFYVPQGQPGVQVTQGSLALSGGYTGSGEISTAAPFLRNSDFYPANQFEPPPNFLTSVRFLDEPIGSSGFKAGLGQLSFTYDGNVSGAGVAVAGLPDVFTGTVGAYTPLAGPENGNEGPAPGRFTLTLSAPGQPVTTPSHYVVYPGMDGTQPVLYLMSLDPHSASDLVVGKVIR